MCKNFREKGACKYGDRCLFAHGDHELTRRGSPNGEEPKKEEKKPEDLKEQESTKNGDTALTLTKTTVQAADTTLSIQFEGSCENSLINQEDSETLEDQGENSTTLSSIQEVTTPEKHSSKIPTKNPVEMYCFKKEDDFRELLDNLDIENIEILTSHKPAIKNSVNTEKEEEELMLEEKFSLEIEKLLSEEDDESNSSSQMSMLEQQLPIKSKRKSSAINGSAGGSRRLQIFEEITTEQEEELKI